MGSYISILLVNQQVFLDLYLSNYITQDGRSRSTEEMIFQPREFQDLFHFTKPFENIQVRDLGIFDDLVKAVNEPSRVDPASCIIRYLLLSTVDVRAISIVEITEISADRLMPILGIYMPEPFKTDLFEGGHGEDFIGYGKKLLDAFIQAFEVAGNLFLNGLLPKEQGESEQFIQREDQCLKDTENQEDNVYGGEVSESDGIYEHIFRRLQKLIENDTETKSLYDEMFVEYTKQLKSLIELGYQDYLIFGFC